MNQSNDQYRELQRRLDEAARAWRPRHPGWETLTDRLPEQESGEPNLADRRARLAEDRIPWRALIVAATVLVAVAIGIALLTGPDRRAQTQPPIKVLRRGIQVTLFNASKNSEPTLFMPLSHGDRSQSASKRRRQSSRDGAGMALVRDHRMILHLRNGDNTVKFTDVAASIDPTSVRLVSDTDPLGTRVIEQNFEFDLASAEGILERAIEKKIVCVGKAEQDRIEGLLLSFDDDTLVLADELPGGDGRPRQVRTQSVARKQLRAIRFEQLPDNLVTRPTLVWVLRTQTPGDHMTTLSYLCGNAAWRAGYVAVLDDTESEYCDLDLKGWVTIDNRSGATYDQARLQLIAGDVSRVRDPWAASPRRGEGVSARSRLSAGVHFYVSENAVPGFTQKDFFEYKLYTLGQPSTLKDRQIKQLDLLTASRVGARRRHLCRSIVGIGLHPEVRLQIANKESNNLGRPLPKGSVAVMARDSDGDIQFLSRHDIEHTPKDEKINISLSNAVDVVYDYRVVRTERPEERRMILAYEFRVRNHKSKAISVRLVGKLAGHHNAIVTRASDRYDKYDHQTLHFDFRLPPDSEKTVTYSVDYSW